MNNNQEDWGLILHTILIPSSNKTRNKIKTEDLVPDCVSSFFIKTLIKFKLKT